MSKPTLADVLRLYFVKNYKTTAAGLTSIFSALALVVSAFPWAPISTEKLFTALPLLCTGVGLILSKDASTALDRADALPADNPDNVARPQ